MSKKRMVLYKKYVLIDMSVGTYNMLVKAKGKRTWRQMLEDEAKSHLEAKHEEDILR